ncbi:MAG: N-acetylmuramoyl-L-alanine amidase [Bacteroidetes bacterium]|nr:N-acetylmuramoyl-L-alanine amidase [Bacteroidota bacterium]
MKLKFTLVTLTIASFLSLQAQTIVIDPGHGYDSNGGNPDGRSATEHSTSLAAGLRLKTLIDNGCPNWTAHMTRSTANGWISLTQRSAMSNSWNADYYLSIHCNAGGGSGTETFWCALNDNSSSDDITFANKIQEKMVSYGNWIDRRVVEDDSYIFHLSVLRYSNATGCLNEIGFVDYSSDASKLNSSAYRDSFALAYQKAFIALLGGCQTPPPSDAIAPITQISIPGAWQTNNFTATFSDADNTGGSGLEKSYYQVIDYNGTEWRANANNGFFADNFDQAIHPEWTVKTGSWSINNGYLTQSDESNNNTNIYASLNQNLSNRYLYHFVAKIDGSGNNRRAGFHFMCDQADSSQRGNSYFVWLRPDASKLSVYKVTNNSFGNPVVDVPLTINVGQVDDYKIIYDRITGKMSVYQNDILIANWTDSSPISSGNAISFRSGNSNFAITELKVYRSRSTSTAISVGPTSNKDIRYENTSPSAPAGKVKSICTDIAGNISSITTQNIDVDWTSPNGAVLINDGTGADISTSYSLNSLSANWTGFLDSNSGITMYEYAIGMASGDSDVVGWTNNMLNTQINLSGLTLFPNKTYYVSVRAQNAAGIKSSIYTSNGQIAQPTYLSVHENNSDLKLNAWPNPFSGTTWISFIVKEKSRVEINLLDASGKSITLYNNSEEPAGDFSIPINAVLMNLSSGVYIAEIKINNQTNNTKLVLQ